MALDATVSGANANSYVTADTALAYFEAGRNEARWRAVLRASSLLEEKLLLDAMTFLENLRFGGLRTTTTQALEFPRFGGALTRPWQLRSVDFLYDLRGRSWASNAIPTPVKNAQCEMALALGENDAYLNDRVKSKTVSGGSSTIEIATWKDLGRSCPAARFLLDPFLLSGEVIPS